MKNLILFLFLTLISFNVTSKTKDSKDLEIIQGHTAKEYFILETKEINKKKVYTMLIKTDGVGVKTQAIPFEYYNEILYQTKKWIKLLYKEMKTPAPVCGQIVSIELKKQLHLFCFSTLAAKHKKKFQGWYEKLYRGF